MRSPMRGLYAAVAVLCVGPLAAGCGGESKAAEPEEILLQSSAATGPEPFTASTASPGRPPALPRVASAPKSPSGGGVTLRTMSGSAPGLYAGTQEVAACDVAAQAGLLVTDKDKARAFAEGAGVEPSGIGAFLRGLTPVLLRTDVRVTGHGFHDGSAVARQSVLQAGTAILVDQYGAPRVRCASGTPLKKPVPVGARMVTTGTAWPGYRADRTLVVKPAAQPVNNLLLVSVVDNGWIERPSGTTGEDDARPAAIPPVDPDEVFADPGRDEPDDAADPAGAEGASSGPRPSEAAPQPPAEPAAPPAEPAPPVEPAPPAEPGPSAAPQPDLPPGPLPGVPDQVEPEPADPWLPDDAVGAHDTDGGTGVGSDPVATVPEEPAEGDAFRR
ncbi:DUF6777 domain-containing protein [Streptomyces peucetius]|uniref:DUF6777 domain-containing protein n=1 Tax=Streptomyces peucetius TaxID=1950 RepID=A0ABY6IFY8_STRPE|nr:DUF6777 domain-containing protein [Streptomyces peucetius]UYQ65913.1 hypothetical protein OGH68_33615 [Streptomyces peucetius]